MKRLGMYIYALLNCLYVFTIGYAFKSSRKLISNMCEIFGYQKVREYLNPDLRPAIPTVNIRDIADDYAPIILPEAFRMDGNIKLLELSILNKIVKKYPVKNIFEIGTFNGRTTLNLACNSAQDAKIYTLDIIEEKAFFDSPAGFTADKSFVGKVKTGFLFKDSMFKDKITQLYGDSATFDFAPYENSMDMVFVDGAHNYNYILNDSEKALKLLRNGRGIIFWHDYAWDWPDCVRALNRLYTKDDRFKDIKHIKGTALVIYAKFQ